MEELQFKSLFSLNDKLVTLLVTELQESVYAHVKHILSFPQGLEKCSTWSVDSEKGGLILSPELISSKSLLLIYLRNRAEYPLWRRALNNISQN